MTGNNTTVSVNYTAASAANTAMILVGGGYALTMSANKTLAIGAGGVISVSGGTLVGDSTTTLALNGEAECLAIGDAGVVSLGEIDLTGNTTANAVRYNGMTTGGTIVSNIVMQNSGKTFNVDNGQANFDLVVSGNIGDGGNGNGFGYGFTKTGFGTLFLTGTNTMTGYSYINQGVVQFKSVAAMPREFASAQYWVASGAMLAVSVGGAGEWSATDLSNLLNGGYSFGAGASLGIDTTDGSFTFNNNITGSELSGGLTKLGPNTLTLGGSNTYVNPTTIVAGTLQLGSSTALLCSTVVLPSTGGNLDLNGYSATLGGLSGNGNSASAA